MLTKNITHKFLMMLFPNLLYKITAFKAKQKPRRFLLTKRLRLLNLLLKIGFQSQSSLSSKTFIEPENSCSLKSSLLIQ